jgi:hypothetical protein
MQFVLAVLIYQQGQIHQIAQTMTVNFQWSFNFVLLSNG